MLVLAAAGLLYVGVHPPALQLPIARAEVATFMLEIVEGNRFMSHGKTFGLDIASWAVPISSITSWTRCVCLHPTCRASSNRETELCFALIPAAKLRQG